MNGYGDEYGNGHVDGYQKGHEKGYKKGHEKACGTGSRRVKRTFRLLRGLVWGAALLLFAGLVACTPPAGGSLDGFHRETIPDLKEELYLVAELAERAEIVNPRYAGTDTAEWEGELPADTYTIPPRAGEVQLSPREIYPKDEAAGNFLLGTYPNQFFSEDASAAGSGDRLFSVNSGDNTITIYDESTLELIDVLDLGQNVSPWAAALSSAEADKIFVTGWESHTVYAADLSSGEILWERDLSQGLAPDGVEDGGADAGGADDSSEVTGKAPEGIVYYDNGSENADDDYLFVTVTNFDEHTLRFGAGYVAVLDASDGRIVNAVSLEQEAWDSEADDGSNPQSLFIDYARDELHVICTGTNGGVGSDDGEVVILDIKGDGGADDGLLNGETSSAVITRLPVGGSPVVSAAAIDWANRVVYLAGVKYLTAYYMGSESYASLESAESPQVLHGSGSGSADPILEDENRIPLYGAVAVYRPNKPAESEDSENSDGSAPESKLFISHFPEDQLIVLQLPDDPLTAAPGDYTELGKIDTGDGPKFLLMHTEED